MATVLRRSGYVSEGATPEKFGKTPEQLAHRARLERAGLKKELRKEYGRIFGGRRSFLISLPPDFKWTKAKGKRKTA